MRFGADDNCTTKGTSHKYTAKCITDGIKAYAYDDFIFIRGI